MEKPGTKITFFFIYKCLPFGASISCALFQEFSDCLKFLADWKIKSILHVQAFIKNYLDDFLFVSITVILGNKMTEIFLNLCKLINCPINQEKTEWATQLIIFFGILLNGRTLTMSVPEDKKIGALQLLEQVISNKKETIHVIQKLTGILNFLNKAIIPGRAFTRGMYQKLKLRNKKGEPLGQYHHVNLKQDFLLDCRVWHNFLKTEDLRICRPFLDLSETATRVINYSSDAAKKITYKK